MRVIIVTRSHEFPMEIGFQESILEIKKRIQGILGIPSPSQTLTVSGWNLDLIDGLDMEDYPIISDGTKLRLSINSSCSAIVSAKGYCPDKFKISVKFSSRKIDIEVDKTETVKSLKEKIHIVENTPIKRMALFFSGLELSEDFRNLSEYGINEYSEIIVFYKSVCRLKDAVSSKKLNVVVQTSSSLLNSACIPLEIKDSSTVKEMREMLLGEKALPQDDYLFIHKQRIMREACSLRWHGVENGDFLYVFKGTVSRGG